MCRWTSVSRVSISVRRGFKATDRISASYLYFIFNSKILNINDLYYIFRSLNTFLKGYGKNVSTSSSQTAVFGCGRRSSALLFTLASYQTFRFHISRIYCLFIRCSLCYVALVIYVEFLLQLFLFCCLTFSVFLCVCAECVVHKID